MNSLINMNKKLVSCYGQILLITIVILGFESQSLLAQDSAQQIMLQGAQYFWNAEFEDAIKVLQQAIRKNMLNNDQLFSAHLYIGFSLLRLDSSPELAEQNFSQAIKINPQLKLDSFKIPPDLIEKFEKVRSNMIGSLYITSNPPGADIVMFRLEDSANLRGKSPNLFKDLIVGTYNITVLKEDYEGFYWQVNLSPGMTDTLKVDLKLKPRPIYKRWWTWAAGGGIIVTSVYAILTSGSSQTNPPVASDLPMPPERPR